MFDFVSTEREEEKVTPDIGAQEGSEIDYLGTAAEALFEQTAGADSAHASGSMPNHWELQGEDGTAEARDRAYENMWMSDQQTAIEAHDRAFAAQGLRRAAEGEAKPQPQHGRESRMPVTAQWISQPGTEVTPEQLKRMVTEMTTVNRKNWSHETIRQLTNGPTGTVEDVMASLSQGPLSETEAFDFSSLDFESDVLSPDWKLMETEGILPTLREAKARVYADGSAPKIRTALNQWRRYVKTKARVSFLRPRIGDDPERFMTESLLRQGFIAFCVSGGCSVDTAEQYASLFNGWHIDTMGYGLVSSRSFQDEQFRRTNQGLRRMFPAKRIDRAAHPAEINSTVLRKSLDELFAIYDEASTPRHEKCRRMELWMSRSSGKGFDLDLTEDLVYSALTELMTDGLLRPGEGLPKRNMISQKDVTFKHDAAGRLESVTVMITPIKRRGKHVGDKSKRPVAIAAHRGGNLRTAELLDILNMLSPCLPGAEATTPAIRFPVSKIEGLSAAKARSLSNPTMNKTMKWYHAKCKAAGVPHYEQVKPHSFRIAGATLLFAAGIKAEEIQTMGRWCSAVYQIYCRLSKERLLELSRRMGNAKATQFLNGVDGFMESLLEVEPVEDDSGAGQAGDYHDEVTSDEDGDDEGDQSNAGDGSEQEGSDDESWLEELKTKVAQRAESRKRNRDSVEGLFDDSDSE